jgi:hypothetical protein
MVNSANAAQKSQKMMTTFGELTVTKIVKSDDQNDFTADREYIIRLGKTILYKVEYPGMSAVEVVKLFKQKDRDVILVSFWDGGNAEPCIYNFISFDKSVVKKSKDFRGPDSSLIKVTQVDDKITVKYPYPIKGFNYPIARPPIVYQNGTITTNGKKL